MDRAPEGKAWGIVIIGDRVCPGETQGRAARVGARDAAATVGGWRRARQSPNAMPMSRAVSSVSLSSGTVFMRLTATLSGS